jgi:hypothetical protein
MLLMCRRRRLLDHAALQDEDLQFVVLSCHRERYLGLPKLALRRTDRLHLPHAAGSRQIAVQHQLSGKSG